ncbi:MAG: hemerythrin family protein [Candidatus Aenigmarchaeota archaeon]|nr:hemerythrin family protein [Candidatus Aenigmarchaeota archaeon]
MGYEKKVAWNSSMSVGEETIDTQHKKLIGQINKLIDILSSLNVDMGSLRETGHFLYTYIKEHFAYEEEYMEKNDFPGLEGHKKIHANFIQFYKDFQTELKEDMTSGNFSSLEIEKLMEKIKKYLLDWLVQHIKGIDQEYAKYIKSHDS